MKSCASLVVVTVVLAGCSTVSERPRAQATPASTQPVVHEELQALNWVQTSLEYEVATRQAFVVALERVDQALADPSWTAALEQEPGYEQLPAAVIVDVDETILDNSPFEAGLVKRGVGFDQSLWEEWVEAAQAEPVPGAKEFITKVKERGVQVFYVTNRTLEAPTVANLQQVIDSDVSADEVMCRNERGWGSDKSPRRAEVAQTHRVLVLVGDDYNDFALLGKVSPQQRRAQAQAQSERWGVQWIIIPNPLYGSFDSAVMGWNKDLSEAEQLRRRYELLDTGQ